MPQNDVFKCVFTVGHTFLFTKLFYELWKKKRKKNFNKTFVLDRIPVMVWVVMANVFIGFTFFFDFSSATFRQSVSFMFKCIFEEFSFFKYKIKFTVHKIKLSILVVCVPGQRSVICAFFLSTTWTQNRVATREKIWKIFSISFRGFLLCIPCIG